MISRCATECAIKSEPKIIDQWPRKFILSRKIDSDSNMYRVYVVSDTYEELEDYMMHYASSLSKVTDLRIIFGRDLYNPDKGGLVSTFKFMNDITLYADPRTDSRWLDKALLCRKRYDVDAERVSYIVYAVADIAPEIMDFILNHDLGSKGWVLMCGSKYNRFNISCLNLCTNI